MEFAAKTADEYEKMAEKFMYDALPSGVKECRRSDGGVATIPGWEDGGIVLCGSLQEVGTKMYTCPVCGFDRLEDPPNNYTICPSCGTEFEYDDVRMTRAELRRAWVEGGYKWWSELERPPARWNPERQLEELIHPSPVPIRTGSSGRD